MTNPSGTTSRPSVTCPPSVFPIVPPGPKIPVPRSPSSQGRENRAPGARVGTKSIVAQDQDMVFLLGGGTKRSLANGRARAATPHVSDHRRTEKRNPVVATQPG